MATFRKDPFGPAWVLISPERGLRPSDFGSVPRPPARSPLSPGEEGRWRELDARRPSGSRRGGEDWRMRVIEHPGALLRERTFAVEGEAPFRHAPGHGRQEIVVEHPDAAMRLETFPREHLVDVLRLWRERVRLMAEDPTVRHVQATRSVGTAAGAPFEHPHASLLASPVPSRWVEEEVAAAAAHHDRTGRCLFCEVAAAEAGARERLVASNDAYLALTPYASKTPFEAWILPRRHGSAFAAEPVNDLAQLAELLQALVRALATALADPPYNLLLHTLPHAGDPAYHWHLELLPRVARQAGFDWGSGYYVNPTPPEDAARFLREAMALEEA
jgi:UDPglucose--hexose-1-phosphate uridylyltransferase